MSYNRPLIKICGMRDGQNILETGKLRPDYMGFIAYPLSKRFVTTKPAQLDLLPESIKRVGVFVNQSLEDILKFALLLDLDIIQLHGEELPEFTKEVKEHGFDVWKTFGVSFDSNFDFDKLIPYLGADCTDAFLFDTKTSVYGGSGQKFDWKVLERFPFDKPFWLSGGLKPQDLEDWSKRSVLWDRLMGLDLNSGFEISPGVKNLELLDKTLEIYRTS